MGCKPSKEESKKIALYYDPMSAPCRTVMLTAQALNVKLDLKPLNLREGEHMKPEFLKINPQHCIPTLKDGNFALWESRAIAQYLANQYGADDALYPKDPKRRAVVDARLNFDQGFLYQRLYQFLAKAFLEGKRDEELFKKSLEGIDLLNTFLEGHLWAAGDTMTIADFALVASVSTAESIDDFDVDKYPNVAKWLARCKANMKGYDEANQAGINKLKQFISSLPK